LCYDVGLLKVGSVCRGSTDFDGFGIRLALQDAALDVEHICESGIEIILKLFGYEKAWRDNKRAASLEGKRGESNAARLAATDGQHHQSLPGPPPLDWGVGYGIGWSGCSPDS
jgi:hypothetical protein